MKKIVINQLLCFAILIIVIPAQSQLLNNQMVSKDTLVAGDSTMILCNIGFYDEYTGITGGLFPTNWPEEYYPGYNDDTIYSYKTEKYNDTIVELYFYVPFGTYPSTYYLSVFEEGYGIFMDYYPVWIMSRPIITEQPRDLSRCPYDTATFKVKTVKSDWTWCHYQWYHNNVSIEDQNNPQLFLADISNSDTGNYYCTVSNDWGVDTSVIVRLVLLQVPDSPSQPKGSSSLCYGITSSEYSIGSDPFAIDYIWSILPESAGTFIISDTSATITWNNSFTGTAKIYVTPLGEYCTGENSDTLVINIDGPPEKPEICIVGIDEESNRNRIVWEKTDDPSIVSYQIYRETNQTDVYLQLATLPHGDFSIYVDSSSIPGVVSQRYKISILDTCGNESDPGNAHKTMHLASNIGTHGEVNLIWEHYEGFAFLSYNIYRGTHPDSLAFLTSVPSNVSLYTDQNPPEGDIYYQIEVIHPEGCNPSKKTTDYSISRSNIIHVETSGIGNLQEISDFRIFPNPAHETLIIFSEHTKPVITHLYNSSGMQIREFYLEPGQNIFNISQLPEGIYFLNFMDNNEFHRSGFVKLK